MASTVTVDAFPEAINIEVFSADLVIKFVTTTSFPDKGSLSATTETVR